MHAASQLFVEAFEVQIEGERVSPDTVFPDWSPLGNQIVYEQAELAGNINVIYLK